MKRSLVVLPLAVLTAFTIGCQNQQAHSVLQEMKAQVKVEEQNKEIVRRYWDGKWNQRSPAILDELQSPDVVYRSPSMEMNGLEEYKLVYGAFASALHDSQLSIDDIIAEDDKVMTRVTLRCTHKGELEGIPATGKTLTVSAFTVFRLVDGKIVEEHELLDELGMMHQLGMELGPAAVESK
jgi:steroid delta-isomerase-like uncharacterized protein